MFLEVLEVVRNTRSTVDFTNMESWNTAYNHINIPIYLVSIKITFFLTYATDKNLKNKRSRSTGVYRC